MELQKGTSTELQKTPSEIVFKDILATDLKSNIKILYKSAESLSKDKSFKNLNGISSSIYFTDTF
ncbi:hypothetical protein HK096_001078, partial [Nowakowskiella sp. JEL0078]